jgi:Amt family ammonium transporter
MDGGIELIVVSLACGALLIRVGFAWCAAGAARSKNAGGAAMRSVIDLAVTALAFWALGAAIMNGGGAVLGLQPGLLSDVRGEASASTFVQLVLVIIGTGPVAAAMAERSRFFPLLATPAILGAIVIPICGHWVWNAQGWLARLHFVDIAGASVLHVVGGIFALAGAIAVGARSGKYNRDGSANLIPGHSVPMASVGVLLILIGWAPYVTSASLLQGGFHGRTAINVLLAASSGALTASIISHIRYGKPDIMLTYGGLLGGLVAISAGGGAVSTIAAVIIGAIAGVIVPTATVALDLRFKVDDPSGGVAVHLLGGAWGTLAAGFFLPSATWADRIRQIGVQTLGFLAIALFAIITAVALFLVLRSTIGLRLHEDAEYDGTDLAEHDVNAYPDFQQTMIKSYHLREA